MTNLTCPINKTSVITCFQMRAAPTLSPPHKLSSEVFKTWCVPFMNDYSKWEGTLECLSRGIPVTIKPWQDGIMVGREKTSSSHYKWRHQQLRRVITFFPSFLSSYLYANPLPRAPICQRGWISQFFYSDVAQGCRVSSTVGEIRIKARTQIQPLLSRDSSARSLNSTVGVGYLLQPYMDSILPAPPEIS